MSKVFKEAMRELEKDRISAQKKIEERRRKQYSEVSRLADIDNALSSIGLKLTKAVLLKKGDREELVSELNRKNTELLDERAQILKDKDFPPNDDDLYKCANCKDTGFIGGERCTCLQQRLISKYYAMSNLSKTMENENFDTFDFSYYSNEVSEKIGVSPRMNIDMIWKVVLNFVHNFDNSFDNLLFYGETGLGKTFLSNCIAKELLDKGKTVLYVTAPQLFKQIEEFRFNRDENDEPEEYYDMITNSDLLIIDDLGTEFQTSVTDSELFNFINTRILNRKSTIISTNLLMKEIQDSYSERITSRISGNYKALRFFGDDIRTQKKYRGKK